MNSPFRPKPLARYLCCGLASLIVGACAGEASAQEALRVDPVLLGLPPLQAPAAVEPAPKAATATPAAAPGKVEVQAVEAARVEKRPVAPAPAAAAVQPAATADAAPSLAPDKPSDAPVPTSLPPAPAPLAQQPVPRSEAVVRPPARPAAPSTGSASATLRVDPALLGPEFARGAAAAPAVAAAAAPVVSPTLAAGAAGSVRVDDDGAAAAIDATPALALRAARAMTPPPKESETPRPTFVSAQRMDGQIDREFVAEGEAELRKIGTVVNADRLTYWPIEDEIEAEGNVRIEQGDDRVSGPKMRMKIEDQVGYFEQPTYTLKRAPQPGSKAAADKAFAEQFLKQQEQGFWNSGFAAPSLTTSSLSTKPGRVMTEAHGNADRIDFEGENQVRLKNATYTTCEPGNDDWYMKTSELKLDYDREVGTGTHGTVYFKDLPILYSPWLTFSLNNERKSGLLAPSFGTTSNSGAALTLPYYWNIAPNMDATIAPRVMTRRGLQVNNEFRYLNTGFGGLYKGEARVEVLPGDRLRDGENRYGISLVHTQTTASGFSGTINYNRVSDDDYYTDLSSRISNTSQTQLLQQGVLTYGASWWSATANFQRYQSLQPDRDVARVEQYQMLPQLTINARKPDFYYTDSTFLGQYTAFVFPTGGAKPDAQRTVLYPQVALPFVTPGWYVTPKIGVNVRHYALSGQAAGVPDSISSTLPVFTVDSGMTFERSSHWFGRDYTQTLEPRLYYVNIPYKDQSEIPIFDSGLADFNFAQIFAENQFTGWDRVNNANQLTAAVTSRLLDPENGNEIMRAMLGQRFYFSRNRVGLGATSSADDDRNWDRSDVLAAFSGQVLPKVYLDTAVQYGVSDRELKRYSAGVRYQPAPGKTLNAAYRYNRDATAPIDQVDVSGQWPLSGRWHVVGRFNYSFKDDATSASTDSQGGRLIESIAGLEYNGGCWVVRGVVQRLALTQEKTSTAFYIQLELNDFARIGSNPLNLLKRNVPGYGLINQPAADPVFGE